MNLGYTGSTSASNRDTGQVHTSAATVMVLPEAEEFDVEVNMNDVRIDYFCSSGPGGQSVNTTYSAVRLSQSLLELLPNVKIKSHNTRIKKSFKGFTFKTV